MSNIDIEKLKNLGFSFEEINSLKESEKNINEGKVLSKNDMKIFIETELLSKYQINV